jgi:hypothetical protein
MGFLLLVLTLYVEQSGDTLFFTEQDSIIDYWIIAEEIRPQDSGAVVIAKKVKISPDKRRFFIYEEMIDSTRRIPLQTRMVLFDAQKTKLWEEFRDTTRFLSYRLSNVYDSLLIIVDTEHNETNPSLSIIKDNKKDVVINKGEWHRIVRYDISPGYRYIIFHNRNPYFKQMWDYIYSIDLVSKKNWTYLFPLCLSCKRGRIYLSVDDRGTAEVIHKGEHRVFSNDGNLLDFYIE